MQSIAFAPGHVSGFFQPCYDKDPLKTGSRGAGFSVSLGARTQVTLEPAMNQSIQIRVNNHLNKFPVVYNCIQTLLQHKPFMVSIDIQTILPFSQGFGMSAACSLGSALGIAQLLHLPQSAAIAAAHTAEVTQSTGLGDVIGCSNGGIEIRKNPGVPPFGLIQSIPGSFEVLLGVIDTPITTKDILKNADICENIALIGNQCTNKILENPTVETFFALSKFFAEETGLATQKMMDIIKEIESISPCSMCMLGNALFTRYSAEAESLLQEYGTTYHTSVDLQGARLLF